MDGPPVVSFCATNLNTADRLLASLASVAQLGSGLDSPFEIVVADGPSDDGARTILEAWAGSDRRFHLVPHAERNRGFGRRLAFESSHGAMIVPFDTSLVYDPVYAGLLRAYLALRTNRMLFSEIAALPREGIIAVGGWRDLIGGEDIDLYARVIRRYGILAYPTALSTSQSARLGAGERQLRYVRGSRWRRFVRIYAVQRDQMIGANYRVVDLLAFHAKKPASRRFPLWCFYVLCALGARFRGIEPIAGPENNYLVFREAILRSLKAGDFRELAWSGPPPRLLLTDDEITYLSRRSRLWQELGPEVEQYVGRK
jgi:glycosyltransferase involved in cell wall biosynthesis